MQSFWLEDSNPNSKFLLKLSQFSQSFGKTKKRLSVFSFSRHQTDFE